MLANLLIMKLFTKRAPRLMKTLCLLLLILPLTAHAAVYKHVDDEGRLIKYSDQPQKPGDKPITMSKPSMVYESEKPEQKSTPKRTVTKEKSKEKQEATPVVAYSAVAILKPEDEEAIRANSGSFPIELASQPALDANSGHRYVIIVDGEKHTESASARITLKNMDRGAHTISAEIWDKSENILASSSNKKIYVLRASAR
jgi:hypothetical protein